MTEKSKTFRFMGRQIGVKAERKSQRGWIARKYFAQQEIEIPKIELKSIKFNNCGRVSYL